jgi:hypothetical protein
MQSQIYTRAYSHSTHTLSRTHLLAHIYAHTLTSTHPHPHTMPLTYPHPLTFTHPNTHTCTPTHTHVQTYSHIHKEIQSHIHARILTHQLTYPRTNSRTHTNLYSHTWPNTHSFLCIDQCDNDDDDEFSRHCMQPSPRGRIDSRAPRGFKIALLLFSSNLLKASKYASYHAR